jgi:hypothetical protein
MIRNEGRATDTSYATGSARCPAHLSFACLVNGFEPVPLDKPFTYIELGFNGEQVEAHRFAADAPHGRFYTAGCSMASQSITADAGISNLTLLEHSVAELAQGMPGLPRFDFIALCSEYDRIPVESRRHVVDFMARHLKPGGIAYTRYNAMPGGAAGHPLQQLVLEYEACHAQARGEGAVHAHDLVQAMADGGAKYFDTNPGLQAHWDHIKAQPAPCLSRMEPLYFADVARDFAVAKLDFAGAADPWCAFPGRYLTAEQQGLLDSVADMVLHETLKDYLCNTTYRSDVFVRGTRRMHALRQSQWLERCGLVPMENNMSGAVSLPLLEASAKRPLTLAELKKLPAFREERLATLLETAALLVAAGHAVPFFANYGLVTMPRHDRASFKDTKKRKASELE